MPPMGVHALRHTFATRAVESDIDLHTISAIPVNNKKDLQSASPEWSIADSNR